MLHLVDHTHPDMNQPWKNPCHATLLDAYHVYSLGFIPCIGFGKAKEFKDPNDGRAFFSFVDHDDGLATKLMKVVGIDPEFLTRKINLDLSPEERSAQGGMEGTIDLQ